MGVNLLSFVSRLRAIPCEMVIILLLMASPVIAQPADNGPLPSDLANTSTPSTNPDTNSEASEGSIRSSWNISIMFNLSDRRKLDQVLDVIRRRKELREQMAGITDQDSATGRDGGLDSIPGLDGSDLDPDIENVIRDLEAGTRQTEQQLAEAKQRRMREVALDVYLNSIMYKSDSEWAVWMNGKRVTPTKPYNERVSITHITPKYVDLLWETMDLYFIAPDWEDRVKEATHIRITDNGTKVRLRLFPNQTFISRGMQIIEGKALSVEPVQVTKPKEAPPEEASTNEPAETTDETDEEAKKEESPKLMDALKAYGDMTQKYGKMATGK